MRILWTGTTAGQLCALALLLLAGVLLTSCVSVRVSEDSDDARAPLESASYLTENTREGSATLEDGEFREQAAPGSAAELVIRLGKWSLGDIDGQGDLDAAAITVEDPGGSGTFYYLHALIGDEDDLRDAAVAFLGDRIRIEGVSVHDGVITVALLDRPPDAPFVEPPSVPVIRQFRLQGDDLAELSGASSGTFACDASLRELAACAEVSVFEGADDARSTLESATYLTENTREREATLEDGEFRAPVAPGSAAELVIRLGKWSLGDIDGQGALDAAAVTVEDPGGSGTFYYLHALTGDEGAVRDGGVAFLGDRIRIEGVSIHDGVITVALLDRPPDAPFVEPPSVPVIRQFRLQGGDLAELSGGGGDDEGPVCDSSLPDAALVIVVEPASGQTVSSGFRVSGCSRTHESNVNWQLLDRSGAVLAEGFTSGGGFDGPGEFSFTVEYQSAERQLANLEVFELDESEGQGFPPPRDIVPLWLDAAP